MVHIRIGFIDYGAFSFEEGKIAKGETSEQLWERYVYGLLEGTLQTGEISSEFQEIPPNVLAQHGTYTNRFYRLWGFFF